MRIVIDLQASQSVRNRNCKIGQASLAMSRAIAKNAGAHEIWVALNGAFPETVEPLRASFEGLLSQDRIRVWRPPQPPHPASDWGGRAGEFMYEAFLASLSPDAVLVTSLFEGFDDSCFTSIGAYEQQPYLWCVLLHEIVPALHGDSDEERIFKNWHEKKLGYLRRADLCLAASESLRGLLIEEFGFPPCVVTNISPVSGDVSDIPISVQLPNGKIDHYVDCSEAADTLAVLDKTKLAAVDLRGPFKHQPPDPEHSLDIAWDASSKATLAALEAAFQKRPANGPRVRSAMGMRKRLAYVSPIPPQESGIADYGAQLVPELSRHYDIDLITSASETTDPSLKGNCRLRSPDWFDRNAYLYDRIIYHFGNSVFHKHMFQLLEHHPGVVVLHDFFLGHVLAIPDSEGTGPDGWRRVLRDAHGYGALIESLDPATQVQTMWKYPVNLDVLHNATGIVVHSEHSRELARQWYGIDPEQDWRVIPLVRHSPRNRDREAARARLGYEENDYLVCSFGGMGETKRNKEALTAWSASSLASERNCHLCFVGGKGGADYADEMERLVSAFPGSRIRLTDAVDSATYQDYLTAADCAIQLRGLSRGETSAAALDCMAHGLPLIVNANGSMKELPAETVALLKDNFTFEELAKEIEDIYRDKRRRRLLGQAAADHIRKHHSPRQIADLYQEAIESFSTGAQGLENRLVGAIGKSRQNPKDAFDWLPIAKAINHNHRRQPARKRMFVDVTEVAKNDLKTGIERVVRNVLKELLKVSDTDYLITPVYFDPEGYWRHATLFVSKSFSPENAFDADDVVDIRQGDIFVMLDLTYHSLLYFIDKFLEMRNDDVRIYVCVFDILPINFPFYFPSDAYDVFSTRFDKAVSVADGLICISRNVADEVDNYLRSRSISRHRPLSIGWFHLGSDLMTHPVEMSADENRHEPPNCLAEGETILMVGTVEPRKGHADAVAAFEELWAGGSNLNLVICGKQGWMVEDLSSRIRRHSEFGKRLFWFEGASDSILDELYRTAKGVLVASEGEGFGLPLVEAANHGCPILARDLPVFREVAGDCAAYFRGGGAEMAAAIENWLVSVAAGTAPDSKKINPISWTESADQLLALMLSKENPRWVHKIGPSMLQIEANRFPSEAAR
jgi:glycosyltransferase involved in cell wall biosynthesis